MVDFNYDEYKKEAMKSKKTVKLNATSAKKVKKTKATSSKNKSSKNPVSKHGPNRASKKGHNVKTKVTPTGSAYPYVRSQFGWNRYGIRELEETVRIAPIARSLWQLQMVAFPYFDFKIVAPRNVIVNKKDEERLLPKMEATDRKIDTTNCCKQTMYDVMTYGSSLFEIVWGEDEEGWIVPIALQRLPAVSFRQAPTHVSGNTTRYQCGNLLKGIVLDKETNLYHYYQLQDETSGVPVEIPAANIIHIKDSNSTFVDGEPYLAGIVSTVAQLEFVRKRMMQTISRVGSPQTKVTVGVPKEYLEAGGGLTGALPGENTTLADAMYSQLWEFGSALSENYSADASVVVPYGIDVDWQRPSVPLNPTEMDQYLIREAVSHIFPRDVLEVLSNSISTTSAPLLELLKIMVQGWQQICSIPFENQLWTKFLLVNGFREYRIELEWAPLIPEDPKIEENRTLEKTLQLFDRHIITLEECRDALGLDTSKLDELKKVLYEEMLAYKAPQSLQYRRNEEVPAEEGGLPTDMAGTPDDMNSNYNENPDEESNVPEEDVTDSENVLSEGEDLLAELESLGYGE